MTYCVALRVEAGLVMLSDTRTNAGLDNIGMFRKTFTYEKPGERAIALLCSGNLSVTQEVRTKLSRAMKDSVENPDIETLLNCATMHRVAHLVGEAMKAVQSEMREDPCLRPAQGRQAAALHGLFGRQFHRGDGRHAFFPDRRA